MVVALIWTAKRWTSIRPGHNNWNNKDDWCWHMLRNAFEFGTSRCYFVYQVALFLRLWYVVNLDLDLWEAIKLVNEFNKKCKLIRQT